MVARQRKSEHRYVFVTLKGPDPEVRVEARELAARIDESSGTEVHVEFVESAADAFTTVVMVISAVAGIVKIGESLHKYARDRATNRATKRALFVGFEYRLERTDAKGQRVIATLKKAYRADLGDLGRLSEDRFLKQLERRFRTDEPRR